MLASGTVEFRIGHDEHKQTLQPLEADPASGYLVMRRLSALIARYLAEPGAK